MANRRMFAKSVIGSARFLRMPPTSRLLYYDLGMQADDDGIVEAFSVMRTTAANEDDLRVLVSKGFVTILDNEDLIAYITDWNTNNTIRQDRYSESRYKGLLVRLQGGNAMDTIGVPAVNQMETNGTPMVNQMETQVRLGEVKLSKAKSGKGRGAAEPPKGFAPPTLSELELFCSENGLNIDCERFLYYYEARGWKLSGGMAMTDWKAAVRSWERREHNPDLKNQNDKKGDNPEDNPYYMEGAITL